MCQNIILTSEFQNARIMGKILAKFYLSKPCISNIFPFTSPAQSLTIHKAPDFRICISAPSSDKSAHIIQHWKENVLVSCHSATSDNTAPAHAGFASYEFSSNLPSDFESEALFLSSSLLSA